MTFFPIVHLSPSHCLVETITPAASLHDATGELVHDPWDTLGPRWGVLSLVLNQGSINQGQIGELEKYGKIWQMSICLFFESTNKFQMMVFCCIFCRFRLPVTQWYLNDHSLIPCQASWLHHVSRCRPWWFRGKGWWDYDLMAACGWPYF